LILLLFVFVFAVQAQHPQQDPNWAVNFIDSFNTINTNHWYIETGVRQAGTPGEDLAWHSAENVYSQEGQLRLQIKRDTMVHSDCTYNNHQEGTHYFSSGSIITHNVYHYGYYEIYAKLPADTGYWSSFWLWSSDNAAMWENEIDVIEALGYHPDTVIGNIHWLYQIKTDTSYSHFCGLMSDYHWYGIEWNQDRIIWYLDRKIVRQIRNTADGLNICHPMKIILSVGLDQYIDENSVLFHTFIPNSMFVDELNVYRLKCDCSKIVNEIYNFSTFQYGVKKYIKLSGVTQLPQNGNISLRAKEYIELRNGFEVPLGTAFYADVNPCQ